MWELLGAAAFGFVLGWNVYFIDRYRTDQIALSNLASLVGVIGGAAVLALFPAGTRLFGAYGTVSAPLEHQCPTTIPECRPRHP
jgi:hypothetical protein